jgi:serine protease Do
MTSERIPINQVPRRALWKAPVAIAAALLLLSGVAWRGVAADGIQHAPAVVSQAAAPVARAMAAGRNSYADIVKVVAPTVVTIRTEGRMRMSPTGSQSDDMLRRFFGDDSAGPRRQPHREHSLGSGVIISGDGYILTNNHVIAGADNVRVDLTDGRTLTAKVVGSDKPSDLALLKVEAKDLQPLTLGDSDAVEVGDVVLAVGNPLGIGQTVTMGIISAKGRSTGVGDGGYEDFLQTDAPINEGNSGGALVNVKGELVGINSQILSTSEGNIGIGFAIPANMAKYVVEQLRQEGRVRRAQLGVSIQSVNSDMAASLGLKQVGGAIVGSVESGSAADRAGIKRGDVIESFDGQPVRDSNTLRNQVANSQPGATATLAIVRDGSGRNVTVKLGEAEGEKTARDGAGTDRDDKSALGIAVAPVTPELAARAGAPKDAHGLIVEEVNPDGRAADAGVQAGDIIQEVNRQPIETVAQLRDAASRATDRPILLLVNRGGHSLFLTVHPS